MYVVTGVEFIFSINLLISSVKIRKMSLLAPGFPYSQYDSTLLISIIDSIQSPLDRCYVVKIPTLFLGTNIFLGNEEFVENWPGEYCAGRLLRSVVLPQLQQNNRAGVLSCEFSYVFRPNCEFDF